MRINECGKRGINGDKLHTTAKQQKEAESFKDNLIRNLYQDGHAAAPVIPAVSIKNEICINPAENINICILPADDKPRGAEEVAVRGLDFKDCDKIRINVLEGYTLKLKLEEASDAGKPGIYAEAKYEDGRVEAYILSPDTLSGDGENFITKAACEMLEEAHI